MAKRVKHMTWKEQVQYARKYAVAILQSVQSAEDALNRDDMQGVSDHLVTALEDADSFLKLEDVELKQ